MKKVIIGLVCLIILAGSGFYYFFFLKEEENVRAASNPPSVQPFKEMTMNFTHEPAEGRFPFTGGAAIDIDGDGIMEIFVSGSRGQGGVILAYRDGKMIDITSETGLSIDEAAFGAVSIDIENDGDTDLVIAQQDGAWVYVNDNGKFTGTRIDADYPANSFSTAISLADLNGDDLPDLYVTNFVDGANFVTATFNDPDHAKANIMLLNNGNGTFQDVTGRTGTAGVQNSFLSVFVDLDNDGKQDLVVANNTGPLEIWKNNGDLDFQPIAYNPGLGYWMGLGVGDLDKDGDQDLFVSNIGSSIPEDLVRGDLREDQKLNLEWLILRNDGDMRFTDVTADYDLDGYGFAWGGVFEDLNLDGELDFMVAQNYIKWPGHNVNKLPNKAFLQLDQDNKKGFYHLDELGLNNPYYGQSPLIADVNGDGKPDVFWINMAGPVRGFLNQSNGQTVKVLVPDQAGYLGATLVLEMSKGNSYTKQIVAGVGMGTDQTPNVFFAIPAGETPKALQVTRLNGEKRTFTNPKGGDVIDLR